MAAVFTLSTNISFTADSSAFFDNVISISHRSWEEAQRKNAQAELQPNAEISQFSRYRFSAELINAIAEIIVLMNTADICHNVTVTEKLMIISMNSFVCALLDTKSYDYNKSWSDPDNNGIRTKVQMQNITYDTKNKILISHIGQQRVAFNTDQFQNLYVRIFPNRK